MSKSLRIVFMGTPEFAVASLDALCKSRHKVIAVVTAPDRPANRGLKLQQSPVKEYALKNELLVLQPEKLKNEEFIGKLKELNPDLSVVVAFRMLPEVVWSLPSKGTINIHASLLPQYRGSAPINWAIINGETETGVTTFFIDNVIDKGDIIEWEPEPILENDSAGSLHDKLMEKGAKLIVKTVDEISDGIVRKPIPQDVFQNNISQPKLAPKIFREDCRIKWNTGYAKIHDFIRGLSPYPGAWTEFENIDTGKKLSIKILQSAKQAQMALPHGRVLTVDNIHIYVGCDNGCIEVLELKPEGKKAMPAADFLRGVPLKGQNWKIVF